MSQIDKKPVQVDTLLYTKEAKVSKEKTEAELKVEDPATEKALGILQGQGGKDELPTH